MDRLPVLHVGEIPSFDAARWRLELSGEVDSPASLAWSEVRELEEVEVVAPMHGATGWSRLENRWRGVRFAEIARLVRPRSTARFVRFSDGELYDTTLPLEVAIEADVLLARMLDERALPPAHGGPLRLVVPSRYAWKSVKWLRVVEFLGEDRPGFWEARGFDVNADPWREERWA
ncbi:MAG TPA: molybdopterin-dependent oxidoreductase [Planctomycetota bacterium]|nr:molybdopterin-dependent oxidoreductase [Planctomycetota bacterium]